MSKYRDALSTYGDKRCCYVLTTASCQRNWSEFDILPYLKEGDSGYSTGS